MIGGTDRFDVATAGLGLISRLLIGATDQIDIGQQESIGGTDQTCRTREFVRAKTRKDTRRPAQRRYAGAMLTQLYTMQTVEEALACLDAGADHLGLTPAQGGLPGEIPLDVVRDIQAAVGARARCVVLTVSTDEDEIAALVAATRPSILHLCPLASATSPDAVASLRRRLPGVPIMQAVSVTGPESIAEARAYAEVADWLILDTQAPDIPGVGASGAVHDWSVSAAIVQAVAVPVILAGGLSPENVAAAVRAVRPFGVDSLTHTSRALPGGGFRKDLDRVRSFIANGRAADAS